MVQSQSRLWVFAVYPRLLPPYFVQYVPGHSIVFTRGVARGAAGHFYGLETRHPRLCIRPSRHSSPIPPLAWVPLAILIFPGDEPSVIYVTFLVAFFATVLNTLLGVQSIDPDYFRAAACLGATPRDILRDIILPGALPFIFTGLQIAMGAAWFSLVAGEMIAAQYGLGFVIWESYNLIQYPTIVIAMATLGIVGYISSALIRVVGNYLMRWRETSFGLGAT